jgi:hypothetical protein
MAMLPLRNGKPDRSVFAAAGNAQAARADAPSRLRNPKPAILEVATDCSSGFARLSQGEKMRCLRVYLFWHFPGLNASR